MAHSVLRALSAGPPLRATHNMAANVRASNPREQKGSHHAFMMQSYIVTSAVFYLLEARQP